MISRSFLHVKWSNLYKICFHNIIWRSVSMAHHKTSIRRFFPRKHYVDLMLFRCWTSVADGGPTPKQHWFNASWLLCHCSVSTRRWSNVDLMVAQRLRLWANIKSALVECLVIAGPWRVSRYLIHFRDFLCLAFPVHLQGVFTQITIYRRLFLFDGSMTTHSAHQTPALRSSPPPPPAPPCDTAQNPPPPFPIHVWAGHAAMLY